MSDEPGIPPPEMGANDTPGDRPAPARVNPDSMVRDYRHVWTSTLAARQSAEAAWRLPPKRGRDWTKGRPRAILALAVVTLGVVVALMVSPTEDALPPKVFGVWRTDAPRYAKRRFELGAHSVAFQVGDAPHEVIRHEIARIRRSAAGNDTRFVVEYYDATAPGGSELPSFAFSFRDVTPAEIVVANQVEVVWRREPPPKRP